MKESTLVNKILKYLNGLPNCKAIKRHGGMFGRAGEPDITGCHKGKHFEIEVKVGNNKLTEIQLQRLREWADTGAKTFVAYKLYDVTEKIH